MNIQLIRLKKSYGNNEAIRGLNLSMEHGIYALLGPNGAGKSTLMHLLTRNIQPSGGSILINGKNMTEMGRDYLKMLGFMPQQQPLPGYFSCINFLYYVAALKEMNRQDADEQIQTLLRQVNLWEKRNNRIASLSGGMKQRLLIAQAFLGNPELIILDEPTAGLDPQERIRIRNLIGSFRRDRIILIATHVVQDIESISDHLLFLKKGQLVAQLTPEEIRSKMPCNVYEVVLPADSQIIQNDSYTISMLHQENDGLRIRILSDRQPFPHAVQMNPNLEDLYLAVFGNAENHS